MEGDGHSIPQFLRLLVSGSDKPPGGAGEYHPVVNQTQDFHDAVVTQTIDNQVARPANAA